MRRFWILSAIAFLATLAVVLGGVYALGKEPMHYKASETVDLTGTWKAENMSAVIQTGSIEVSMTSSDTSALYWLGTFLVTPMRAEASDIEITSQGDTNAMQESLFGSNDVTKTFVYHPKNDTLTFKLTMLKTTTVVTLKR